MSRKRHDPVDAPVDGDYSYDVVHGKIDGFTPIWTSPEDMPLIKRLGGQAAARGGGFVPAWDNSSDGDAGYDIGNLKLMQVPTDRYARHSAQSQQRNDQHNSAHKKAAKKSGGKYDKQEGQTN